MKGKKALLILLMLLAAVLFTAAVLIAAVFLRFPLWLTILLLVLFTPAGGISLQLSVSILCYTGVCAASLFSSALRSDMKLIGWNLFNRDGEKTIRSSAVSFYKGVPVFRPRINRSGSFSIILLGKYENKVSLDHERGHNWQLMFMGIATYLFVVAIPSPAELGVWSPRGNYYGAPWESLPDVLGRASRDHEKRERVNAAAYFFAGFLIIPAVFWWIRWKKRVK